MKKIRPYLVSFLLLPLITLLTIELIQRVSLAAVLQWPFAQPLEFLGSLLLIFSCIGVFWSLTNSLKFSFFMVFTAFSFFALISRLKLVCVGRPLLPWDFSLGRETTNIIAYFAKIISGKIFLLSLVLFLLGIVLFRFMPRAAQGSAYRIGNKKGLVLFLLALIVLSSFCFERPLSLKKLLALECINWDQELNAEKNGLILSFCLNLQWLRPEEPEGYGEAKIKEVMAKYAPEAVPAVTAPEEKVQPDIIIIMNEAFWDPTLIPGIVCQPDPLQFLRTLQQEHTGGHLLVPIHGGGTVNTEFEVLTGHAMQFLPGGAVSYAQYVREPMVSLASILKEQGYRVTALHSYHNWFYRRNAVYQYLGFDKFISGEFFPEPEMRRFFVSDADVSRMIIAEAAECTEPLFLFAVTVQNHGPYELGYGLEQKIKVEGELTAEIREMLEIYAQGTYEAAEALQMLTDHFQQSERPTIIVFFGDHLPFLGEDFQAYRETGFYQDNSSYAEFQKMYSVPFLLWSNYLPAEEDVYLNSFFVSPYLLQRAGLPGNFYTDYLYTLLQKTPLIPARDFYPRVGITADDLADYRLLQYDQVGGQNYLFGGQRPPVMQEDYFLGRGKMWIAELHGGEAAKMAEGQCALEIRGQNFHPDVVVYVNNKAVPTEFIDAARLGLLIPAKVLDSTDKVKIQVKISDSQQRIIAESNCVILSEMLK